MRNELIDCLKGLLIILVVVGHVIYDFDVNAYNNIIYKFCYSFHMFLFIGISGYLIAHKKNDSKWLKKRFFRLIVPFVIWSCIIIYYFKLGSYFFMFTNPVLWYLVVLFCCDLLLCATNVLHKKKIVINIILIIIINLYCVTFPEHTCKTVKMLAIYYPFYFAGWTINRYKININFEKIYTKSSFAILYPASMIIYGLKDRNEASQYVYEIINFLGFDNWADHARLIFLGNGGMIYNHLVVAPLGCVFAYLLCKMFIRFKIVRNVLSFVGKYTLQIYVLSCFFVVYEFSNIILNECMSILLGVAVPLIIGIIINKNKMLNKWLFGI